jgi:hypothetical protein
LPSPICASIDIFPVKVRLRSTKWNFRSAAMMSCG